MTEIDIREATNALLKHLSETGDKDVALSELFDYSMKLQKLIENTSLSTTHEMLQFAINKCINALEACTRMVNDLELFSSNEIIDEIQTSSLKYLILPSLLGSLTLNLLTKDLSERMNNLQKTEVYFKDFLLRCKNYELNVPCLNQFDNENEMENSERKSSGDLDPNTIRLNKIQHYKLKKELEVKENCIKGYLERPESDEYVREYYLLLLEKWSMTCMEEIENIKKEKDILKSMPNKENSVRKAPQEIKPLKPIIITKNEIQKQVFGLGYPSIPVMTIDDFYYQRFHNQIKNKPSGVSLQDKALKGEGLENDSEEIEKEELLDKDDPAALAKARQWDDWKDDNPRGSGNRHNKG